jgi:hypothetical protein
MTPGSAPSTHGRSVKKGLENGGFHTSLRAAEETFSALGVRCARPVADGNKSEHFLNLDHKAACLSGRSGDARPPILL